MSMRLLGPCTRLACTFLARFCIAPIATQQVLEHMLPKPCSCRVGGKKTSGKRNSRTLRHGSRLCRLAGKGVGTAIGLPNEPQTWQQSKSMRPLRVPQSLIVLACRIARYARVHFARARNGESRVLVSQAATFTGVSLSAGSFRWLRVTHRSRVRGGARGRLGRA